MQVLKPLLLNVSNHLYWLSEDVATLNSDYYNPILVALDQALEQLSQWLTEWAHQCSKPCKPLTAEAVPYVIYEALMGDTVTDDQLEVMAEALTRQGYPTVVGDPLSPSADLGEIPEFIWIAALDFCVSR